MNAYVKRLGSIVLTLAVLSALLLFLAFPARYAESVREGISLWAVSVLPATLPFLFLTAIFTKLGLFTRINRWLAPATRKLFKVSGAGGCAAFISAVSGYPVGARTVLDLSDAGRLSQTERLRTACLATTSGPAFLVGAVGTGMFASPAIGWILFVSHLIGIYLVCFFLRFGAKGEPMTPPLLTREKISLSDILTNSVLSILCVGAAIAAFYAFGQMLADLGAFLALPETAEGMVRGLLEMTTGCSILSNRVTPLSLSLCCFLVTFGGLCVIVQQVAFLSRANVKTLPFVGIKFLQGVVAALVCFALSLALL